MIGISPILLFLLEFFTYFAQRNAHFFLVPILLKILLAKFINVYLAPWKGHIHVVKALIEEFSCNPFILGDCDQSLLHFSCESGIIALIDLLIRSYKLNPMFKDTDGNTPLHIAALYGHTDTVRHLITEYKVKTNVRNKKKDTPLCLASLSGYIQVVRLLKEEFHCSLFFRGRTALHCACENENIELVNLLINNYQLSPICKDTDGNTPLHIAALNGQSDVVRHILTEYKVDINSRNDNDNTPLCLASWRGHIEVVEVLIEEFKCSPFVQGYRGRTLLHQACQNVNVDLICLLVRKYHLNPMCKDTDGNTPLLIAALIGRVDTVEHLITEYKVRTDARNSNNISPLSLASWKGHIPVVELLMEEFNWDHVPVHDEKKQILNYACIGGNSKLLIKLITEYNLGTVLTVVDNDGNTPLHVSTMHKNVVCVRTLLHELNAPLFVRNKLGKTAFDIAKANRIQPVTEIMEQYVQKLQSRIQSTYQQIEMLAKQKFTGKKPLTKVFVVGHPEVGKSTLIDTLKKEGRLSLEYLLGFGKSTVSPHTAGIVPSIYDTEKYGRVIFNDFAGDREYYSSHAAILENIDTSKGVNLYLVVCDLTNDDESISKEYGYWLSFLTYSLQDSEAVSIIAPIGSHADRLSREIMNAKLSVLNNISQKFFSINSLYIIKPCTCVALDCREGGSSQIKQLCRETSLSVPPVELSFETSILLGLLLKDFSNVIACSVSTVREHIEQTGIPLPTSPSLLFSLVKELHDLGLLLAIEKKDSSIENHLIILKIAALTSDVHRNLFSKAGKAELAKHTDELKLSVGIIPESLLDKVLPEYITKECLIKLQYCQEIDNLIVEEDHTFTQSDTDSSTQLALEHKSLLFFPALCELKLDDIKWPSVTDKDCALGWYAKCAENRFDYFPTRFLHVLIVRLSLKFALKQNLSATNTTASGTPSALDPPKNDSTLAELHAFNPRCHVWATGLHWLMENGVEVFVDMPKDAESKELVVVARSSNGFRAECANTLQKVVQRVIEAKVEFCHSILPSVYLLDQVRLKDEPFTSARNVPLYTLSDVERVLEKGINVAVSVDGHHSTPPKYLTTLTRWTMSYWSKLQLSNL